MSNRQFLGFPKKFKPMNKQLISVLLPALFVFSVFAAKAQEKQLIKPNDPALSITGAWFLQKTRDSVVLNRFTPEMLKDRHTYMNPKNAWCQSGIVVSVKTDSPDVVFLFDKRTDAKHRGGSFGIYKDGRFFKAVKVSPKKPLPPIAVKNPEGEKLTLWQITPPPYFGVNFKGIEIDKGSRYKKGISGSRPVYAAIGNSITQGTGQQATYQTYPFILAEKKGWTLYNLAVGGSKISWPVARLLKGKKVDVITILWGYNDWNAGFLPDKQIKNNYTKLLQGLLKEQPKANIYCILPTYTNRTAPKKGSVTLDEIRKAEAGVVKQFRQKGHHNLFLVDGSKITDASFLKPKGSKDVVHFTPAGANKFANALAGIVKAPGAKQK